MAQNAEKNLKKILFVMMSLYNGGAEKSLVNLLNELPKDKFDISVLLFKKEGIFLRQVPEEVCILETPRALLGLFSPLTKAKKYSFIKLWGTAISHFKESSAAKRAAYRWQNYYTQRIPELEGTYDIAIAYISGEVMYYVDEKVKAERKIVWVHNDYKMEALPRDYDKLYMQNMNAIATISDGCADILKDVFPEFKNKIYTIANITSSEVIKKQANEFYPMEYTKEETLILSIGRLTEQKGVDIAIDAAKILKNKGVFFKWYVIGSGRLKTLLEKKIKKNGLNDRFFLLGPRENPYPYIKNCTVFVQTSRFEGKSVVLDEAKILCKPIVVTNYPTVRDQIEDGKEGMIVPINAEGIADGIQKMLKNEELWNGYAEYLKAYEYGNRDEVQKYIELIEG